LHIEVTNRYFQHHSICYLTTSILFLTEGYQAERKISFALQEADNESLASSNTTLTVRENIKWNEWYLLSKI